MAGVENRETVTVSTGEGATSRAATADSTVNGAIGNGNSSLLESSASSSNSGAPVRPPGTSAVVFAAELDGLATDFAVLRYSNRSFISVSQCGRVGNLYLVQRESPRQVPHAALVATAIYDVRCVLGAEDPSIAVAVRSLAEKLRLTKPLLVSLTLPPPTPSTLDAIAALIEARS